MRRQRVLFSWRELRYESMVLDTLGEMSEARGLYASLGFRECAPYYDNPLAGVVYMALDLGAPVPAQLGASGSVEVLKERR